MSVRKRNNSAPRRAQPTEISTTESVGTRVEKAKASVPVNHQASSESGIAGSDSDQSDMFVDCRQKSIKTIFTVGNWEFDLLHDKLTWSKEMFCFFGIKPTDFAGTFATFLSLIHPADQRKVARYSTAAKSGKLRDLVSLEYRVCRPDGSIRVVLDQWTVRFNKRGNACLVTGVVIDITDLTLLEERFRALFEQSAIGMGTIAEDGHFLSTNRALQAFLGYSETELSKMTASQVTHPDDRPYEERLKARLINGEMPSVSWTKRYLCKGGITRWAHLTLYRLLLPNARPLLSGVVQDTGDIGISDLQLAATRRALHMLSSCNEALVRMESEQSLLDEICTIAVDIGGYRMASVLYANDDQRKSVFPASWAGHDDGYFSEVSLSWSENCPEGHGPAGVAIRAGKAVIVQDISADPDYSPWFSSASRRGYRSVIALPLTWNGSTFGVFGLYSTESRNLAEEEVTLLHRLADNLAFGIMNTRARKEQERLRTAIHKIGEGISVSTGRDFYHRLLLNLTQVLGAHGAAIMEQQADSAEAGRAICALVNGQLLPDFHYPLHGGPCEKLLKQESLVIARDLNSAFPDAPLYSVLRADAYVGRTLFDGKGERIGWIFVVFENPIDQVDLAVSTLNAFAMRAAGEVVRQRDDFRFREQAELLDRAHDAISVRSLDQRVLFWNRGAERLLGWTSDEILGRCIPDTMSGRNDVFEVALASLLQHGEWTGELHEKTKDGRSIIVDSRWTLLRDALGQPKSILVISTDVTQRKDTEASLRLLEAAVSSLKDVILITDAESLDEPGPRIVFVNDAFEQLTGYSREEVLGRSPRFLQGPETSREELDRIRIALERRLPVRSEIINYTKGGRPFWTEINIVPLTDTSKESLYFVAVQRDITDRKRTEAQMLETETRLAHAQKLEAIGQITGGIAHDFNNLLTVILGSAEMLAEATQERDDLWLLTSMIQTAGKRGAELTTKLLAFARRQALHPVALQVGQVFDSVLPLIRRTLPANIRIDVTRHDDNWCVFADPGQMESALLNLCINARDAMPNGGHLLLEASTSSLDHGYAALHPDVIPGDYVLVSVTDTGIGIAPDALERVFEPFYTTKPPGKGTGLGLSMVYGFTKQSAGHISIYSELGAGTSVKIYLPRVTHEVQVTSANEDEPTPLLGNETILLVEDDELVRLQGKAILEGLGYQVVVAANGLEALRIAQQGTTFDLLFSDVMMPGGINGAQLAEKIQQLRPGMPVLLCSGYTESSILEHERLDGGRHILHKPYSRRQVGARIRELIEKAKTQGTDT